MEILLALGIFGISFFLLSIGVIFKKKELHAGSCGSKLVVEGEELSCGVCASKEAEVCPGGDKEGYATMAQLGHPTRKRQLKDIPFSKN
jgi:hypothetical protein